MLPALFPFGFLPCVMRLAAFPFQGSLYGKKVSLTILAIP
jgi:hypothetical protein